MVHGLGDHIGELHNMIHTLVENEYLVNVFDLRGHGKSSGTRGFIQNWEEYREDLHTFRKIIGTEYPNLPLFIVSHSLGGVIGLDYVLQRGNDVRGLIAISPAISYEASRMEKILIALMGKLKPDYKVKNEENLERLTRDPDIIEKLKADELRYHFATPGLGRGMMQTIKKLENQADTIQTPLLLQFGLDDEISPETKLRQFFDTVGSKDKQKIEYENMRHRPFDDIGKETFLEDMLKWLNEHI
ncbi:alpha/beta hydrolase [Oceanobacillus salinisoli]|uniref:alpha/beta hydrolase n=1 Tax=Oceanobacillus salinisoli TaxID=2678611 RepID=UPI0012E16ACE|nr:alpha/beta hydrolase [Oceanobacillus salinisoli]